jgi:tetratricopeptide (TPR) repeat protein
MSDNVTNNKLFCTVCGEEVRPTDKFCSSCGAAINNSNKNEAGNKSKNPAEKRNKYKAAVYKKSESEIEKTPPKISAITLIYIFIGLIAVVLILNYLAGVFDKPDVKQVPATSNVQTPADKSGADLQHLQQINMLEETVKNNPKDKESLLELAHLLNDSGFKERAIQKYKLYLQMDPKNADVLVDMGVCYYELRNFDEAIKSMKEALKYNPQHQIAHLNLGIVNMTAGNHDEAIKWLNKAVDIDPNTPIAKRAQELINSH